MAKVAVVTGANKGIGFEIVRSLAALPEEYLLVLACRSIDLGAAAVTKLKEEFKSREFRLVQLDLSEDESIEAFVQEVSHSFDKVDLLFHNAAIAPGFREAILLTMQTNYFGTVKLNRLMLPLLKKSAQPNVVVVSSLLLRNAYFGCSQSIQQRWRSADTEDKVTQIIEDYLDVVQSKRDPNHAWPSLSKNTVYSMSKLAITVVSGIWAKKHPMITINAVCPGWCNTDMSKGRGPRSPRKGAETPVWLGTFGAGKSSGKFWHDKKLVKLFK